MKILIVSGSNRPKNVSEKLLEPVARALKNAEIESEKIILRELNLPFFDSEFPPANEKFSPANPATKIWREKVANADGVIFLAPEYNRLPSAITKNAIDWLYREWQGKPIGIVSYSSSHHTNSADVLDALLARMGGEIRARIHFVFGENLAQNGEFLQTENAAKKLTNFAKKMR